MELFPSKKISKKVHEITVVKVTHQQVDHRRQEFQQTRIQRHHYFEMDGTTDNSAFAR